MTTISTIPKIDSYSLLRNTSLNQAVNILSNLGLTPKRKIGKSWRFKEAGGLSLYITEKGIPYLNSFSDKIVESGSLISTVMQLSNCDYVAACQIIAEGSNQELKGVSQDDSNKVEPPIKKTQHKNDVPFIPNDGRRLKKTFKYELVKWTNSLGQNTLQYFKKKTNLPLTSDFLNNIGVRPLRWINSRNKIHFSSKNIGIAYCTSPKNIEEGNIKIKQPYNKDYKTRYIQSKGNYIFGWNEAKKGGDILVFVAGENDCIALNFLFKDTLINFIALNSESQIPSESFVKELQGKYKNTFCLLDNDTTGLKTMRKMSEVYGIPCIYIADYTEENDVCDILKKEGAEFVKELVEIEIQSKTAIKKRENDPFAIGAFNAFKLDIKGKYIENDSYDCLKTYLTYDNCILKADKGSGKSWACQKLAIDEAFLKAIDCQYAIICVPTTTIAKQVQEDFKKRFGLNVTVIMGSLKHNLEELFSTEKVFITTYNSLHKIDSIIPDSFLIPDEFQELRNSQEYRSGATLDVFEYLSIAKRTLLVSATPLYHFTTGIHDAFNFRLIEAVQQRSQKVIIQPLVYTKGTEKDVFSHIVDRVGDTEKQTHLIKKDNVTLLETWQQSAQQKGKNFDIYSSKKRKYKEGNENYQHILKEGIQKAITDFIGTTSLFDSGVSVKQQIDSINLVNERCEDSFNQFLARPRHQENQEGTKINEVLNVFSYHALPKDKESSIFVKDTVKELSEMIAYAQTKANNANKNKEREATTYNKHLDDHRDYYYSNLHGEYRVNVLYLLKCEYNRQQRESTLEDFYSRIAYYNVNYEIKPIEEITLIEDEETAAIKKEKKKASVEQETKAYDLLCNYSAALFEAVYHTTSSSTLKRKIKSFTPINKNDIGEEAQEFIKEHIELLENSAFDKPLLRFFQLLDKEVPAADIPQLLIKHKKDFKLFNNRLVVSLELQEDEKNSNKLSGKSIERVKDYKSITEAVKHEKKKLTWKKTRLDRKKGKKKEKKSKSISQLINQVKVEHKAFSLTDLSKIVRTATGNEWLSGNQCLMKVKELFELKQIRKKINDKQYKFYTIVSKIDHKKTLASINLSG